MNMFKVLDQVLHIYAEFSYHYLIFQYFSFWGKILLF